MDAGDNGTNHGRSTVTPAPTGPDSAESVRLAPGPTDHPPLAGRIYYLLGGTLPRQYHPWVLHDLTGPRWRIRQACRPPLVMAPFALVFVLLPGRLDVRIMIAIVLVTLSFGIGIATSSHFRDRRLVQHGFPPVRPSEDDE